ncbi:MAG: hypothetical protein ABI051_04720 [Vicinamibacterales bacterium]
MTGSRTIVSSESPRPSVADVQRLAASELSTGSRVGYTVLLVAALTVAVAIGSLWATEPTLPMRTHLGFAVIVAMALTWVLFSAWVLTYRRALLGRDRVLSATIGIVFSAVAAGGMLSVGYWGGMGRPAYLGALMNGALCAAAATLRRRARRRLEALSRRRQELERHLAGGR